MRSFEIRTVDHDIRPIDFDLTEFRPQNAIFDY